MVNLKYLSSILCNSLTYNNSMNNKVFLNTDDINFLNENGFLKSISDDGCISGQYIVEFNKEHLLQLCS